MVTPGSPFSPCQSGKWSQFKLNSFKRELVINSLDIRCHIYVTFSEVLYLVVTLIPFGPWTPGVPISPFGPLGP